MLPLVIFSTKASEFNERSDASQKDSIIGPTRTDIVLLALISPFCHLKILFRLEPIVFPFHTEALASDQDNVKEKIQPSSFGCTRERLTLPITRRGPPVASRVHLNPPLGRGQVDWRVIRMFP